MEKSPFTSKFQISQAVTAQIKNARGSVLFCLFSILAVAQLTVCIVGLRLGSDGRADFRAMYTAAYMLRTGQRHDIYNLDTEGATQKRIVSDSLTVSFIHLPAEAGMFWPLSFLSYRMAYFVLAVINTFLLVATSILMRPFLPRMAATWKPLAFAMFLCYLPAGFVIVHGQTQLLVLLLLALAFIAERRGRDFSAGVFLGLTIIRFEITLPIAILLLAWKRLRMLKGFALAGSVVLILSVLLVGPRESLEYVHTLHSLTTRLGSGSQQRRFSTFPGSMPNLRGLALRAGMHGNLGLFVIGCCSIALLILAARQRPSLPLATTVALLVGYHNQITDLALLILPMAISFEEGSWLAAGLVLVAPIFYASLVARWLVSFLAIPTIGLLSAFVGNRRGIASIRTSE
jgi:hypothetical protein